jgi:acetylornithine/succinyldiaminopimelate/putrescine aminotransferase
MEETLNTNENGNCANRVLSPVVVEALQNDEHLKALYSKLNELHSKAIPKVIQVSEREFKATYGDEFNELVAKFHREINFRQEQIVSFYNR